MPVFNTDSPTDIKWLIAFIKNHTGGGGSVTLTPYSGSVTGNWQSGSATSGLTGADLLTIGTDGTPTKIQSFWLKIKNLTAAAEITVRVYMKVQTEEVDIYSSLGNGQNFVVGIDVNGVWLFNGEICVSNQIRIEVQSDTAADDGAAIGYEYLLET